MPSAPATTRLEARISAELHATLKRAAELQDRTVTDFVIAEVQEAAQRAIQQAGVIALSRGDQERFAGALLTPVEAERRVEARLCPQAQVDRARLMASTYPISPLDPESERSGFHSGVEALDRNFREHVTQDVRRRITSCFVALDKQNRIAGFCTLAATSVQTAIDAMGKQPVPPLHERNNVAISGKRGVGRQ